MTFYESLLGSVERSSFFVIIHSARSKKGEGGGEAMRRDNKSWTVKERFEFQLLLSISSYFPVHSMGYSSDVLYRRYGTCFLFCMDHFVEVCLWCWFSEVAAHRFIYKHQWIKRGHTTHPCFKKFDKTRGGWLVGKEQSRKHHRTY